MGGRALLLALCMFCAQCGASQTRLRGSEATLRPAALIVPPAPGSQAPQPGALNTTLTDSQIAGVLGAIVQSEIAQAHLAEGKAASDGVVDLVEAITKERLAIERDLAGFISMLPRGLERSAMLARVQADADRVTSGMAGDHFDLAYVTGQIHAFERDIAVLDTRLVPDAQAHELERIATELRADIVNNLAAARALRRELAKR